MRGFFMCGLLTAMDGGNADFAGAKICRPAPQSRGWFPHHGRVLSLGAKKVPKETLPQMPPPRVVPCALRERRGRAHGPSLALRAGLASCLRPFGPALLAPVLGGIKGEAGNKCGDGSA